MSEAEATDTAKRPREDDETPAGEGTADAGGTLWQQDVVYGIVGIGSAAITVLLMMDLSIIVWIV